MNYIIFTVLSALAIAVGAKGIPFNFLDDLLSSARAALPIQYPGECGVADYKPLVCTSCNEYSICFGEKVSLQKCPESTPFCTQSDMGDLCTKTPTCATKPIQCTGSGFFPDPFNCERYHVCITKPGESIVRECPPGYFFNMATEECTRKAKESDCVVVQCDREKIWSRFGSNNRFYARCNYVDVGSDTKILGGKIDVYKCSEGSTFDGNTCNFSCTKAGKFPHSDFPNRFINCEKVGSVYQISVGLCEDGTFNGQTQACE